LKSKRPKDYEVKKKELENFQNQKNEGKIDLYYADGSGFSLIPYIPYTWQEIGKTVELPSFRSKTLNLFSIWDAKTDLNLYSIEGSLTSEVVIQYIEDFSNKITKETVLVIDNAPIHKSNLFKNKLKQWKEKGLEIFYLPSYSPHLNLIEHLWRFMKYDWIEFNVYNSCDNLIKYVEK